MTIRALLMAASLVGFFAVGCADTEDSGEPCRTCPVLDHSVHAAHSSSPSGGPVVPEPGQRGALGARIAAAAPYARIVVPAGVYQEPTIVITRPVELVADAGAILDGNGERTVLVVQADDVTVRGFTIRNTGASQVEERAGILVRNAARCTIARNRFENTAFGVYLEKTNGCVVRDNQMQGTAASQSQNGNGIHAWSSSGVTVIANHVHGHRDGIYFEFVEQGRITSNHSMGNTRYGLHFMFSNDCTYEDNTYLENGNGVAVMYSSRVTMRHNVFDRNIGGAAYGLLLKDINESIVVDNTFSANTVGLHLEGANRNTIKQNVFKQNGLALRILANAQDNVVERNDFVANAFDVATNSRSSYSTIRGNYWDRYRGYDLDRDGVGDLSHAPVTLFGLVVEQTPAALVLLRSPFVGLLDIAERAIPSLTPALRDEAPRLSPVRGT